MARVEIPSGVTGDVDWTSRRKLQKTPHPLTALAAVHTAKP
jgi:hypothetical protein